MSAAVVAAGKKDPRPVLLGSSSPISKGFRSRRDSKDFAQFNPVFSRSLHQEEPRFHQEQLEEYFAKRHAGAGGATARPPWCRPPGATREPTSRVLKNPQDWQEESVLLLHEALRFLMDELEEALKTMEPSKHWKWANLELWYREYFHAVVCQQQDAEAQIYLPWLRSKLEVPKGEVLCQEDQQEPLQKMLDEIRDLIIEGGRIATGSGAPDRAARTGLHLTAVRNKVGLMIAKMGDHLAEKEELLPGLLRAAQHPKLREEEEAVVQRVIRSYGLAGSKAALPVMVHALRLWGGDARAEFFLSGLPTATWLLYKSVWLSDFEKRHQGLLASLRTGVEVDPFVPFWRRVLCAHQNPGHSSLSSFQFAVHDQSRTDVEIRP